MSRMVLVHSLSCLLLAAIAVLVVLPHSVRSADTPSRFAYVAIHYEGTPKDTEYILGTRVLLKSIKRTGTAHDVIVLVASNVAQSTRDAFRHDGAMVIEVANVPNPWKTGQVADKEGGGTYLARFEFTLNKLHLWNMTQYERVIYMDADNVVLQNMDELFNCGHFCAVYMNPCNFHTGLIVVKPDTKMYSKLLATVAGENGAPKSYDGADQGFLTWFFSYERMCNSPLFDPFADYSAGPSDEPMMRMPPGYNLNALWFYEKGDWHLYRCHSRFADLEVPGTSLTFPTPTWLKPWYWWPHLIFDANWGLWATHRDRLGESWGSVVVTTVVILLTYIVGSLWFLPVIYSSPRSAYIINQYHVRPYNALITKLGATPFGLLVGLASVGASIYLPMKLLPTVIPPELGWPLFIFSQLAINFVLLVGLTYGNAVFDHQRGGTTNAHSGGVPAGVAIDAVAKQVAKELLPCLLFLGAVYTAVKFGLYPRGLPFHFGKVGTVFVLFAGYLGCQLYRYWKLVSDRADRLPGAHTPHYRPRADDLN